MGELLKELIDLIKAHFPPSVLVATAVAAVLVYMFHQHLSTQRLKEELDTRKEADKKKNEEPVHDSNLTNEIFAGKRVLVVDDEPAVAMLLKAILEHHGYACQAALDGESGLKFVKSESWDLVISDVVMPRMDGVELCRLARIEKKELPFIFITGYKVETAKRQQEEHLQKVPVLYKPVEFEGLMQEIRRAISSALAEEAAKKSSAGG